MAEALPARGLEAGCGAGLSGCCLLRCTRLRKSLPPCDWRCGVEGDLGFVWLMFFLGTRMRTVVDLGEVLEIEVGIDLCGGNAGVTQHFLHGAQVAGGLQHMRGEGVAQQVRMHAAGDALRDAALAQLQLHGARADARAVLADEQCGLVRLGDLVAHCQPRLQRIDGVAAQRHDARLVALAGDAHRGIGKIHVDGIEAHQFGQAQAGRVEQLEHRLVARIQRRLHRHLHQFHRLVGRQRMRQGLGRFRRAQADAGIALAAVIAHQVAVEAAPGRKHARQRAPAQAAAVQLCDVAADVVALQVGQRCAFRRAPASGGCRVRSSRQSAGNSCARCSGRRGSLAVWRGLVQRWASHMQIERAAQCLRDALQEQRAHFRIEALLVFAGEDEQADGLAVRAQRQVGKRTQVLGGFAEPGQGVVHRVMGAYRLLVLVGKGQYFGAGRLVLPQMQRDMRNGEDVAQVVHDQVLQCGSGHAGRTARS